MDCDKYLERMSAVLDNECTAEERRQLDEHLAVCPECAALYEQLCRNAQAARELDCEVPADLKVRIMDNLPEQEQPARKGNVIHWKRWIPVAAAACLVLVVSLLPRGGNSRAPAAYDAPTAEAPQAPEAAPASSSVAEIHTDYSSNKTSSDSSNESELEMGVLDPAEPAANPPAADGSGGDYNYGTPDTPPTAPENTGTGDTAGTNANEFQNNMGDVNIQTGENFDPGLTPGQSTGGSVIGGFDSSPLEPDYFGLDNRQAIRVSYGATPAPGALVIGSVAELENYLAQFGSQAWNEDGSPVPIAGLDVLLNTYTAGFFANQRLLCVVVESGSGSNRYELAGLLRDRVFVKATVPEIGTCDMAAWLLVAEVDTMFNSGDMPEVVIIN